MTENVAGHLGAATVQLVKGGDGIGNLQAWFDVAPPKRGARHWKDCRSAKELARAWYIEGTGAKVPAVLLALLEPFRVASANVLGEPEAQVAIDSLRGESPNLDLALTFAMLDGSLAVGVEAKADESFGDLAGKKLEKAARRIAVDKPTNATARAQELSSALLPPWADALPHLGELRYQLLTGVAGTLAYARQQSASRAVFVVHEFICDKHTAKSKLRRNQEDLDRFACRLTAGAVDRVERGQLIGPIHVPGNDHILATVELFLGKICTELESVPSHEVETSQ
jgi:hypothetical protein